MSHVPGYRIVPKGGRFTVYNKGKVLGRGFAHYDAARQYIIDCQAAERYNLQLTNEELKLQLSDAELENFKEN